GPGKDLPAEGCEIGSRYDDGPPEPRPLANATCSPCRGQGALFPLSENVMLDDPVAKLWALKARDAERKLLRARSDYDIKAARLEHQQALDALEQHRVADRG